MFASGAFVSGAAASGASIPGTYVSGTFASGASGPVTPSPCAATPAVAFGFGGLVHVVMSHLALPFSCGKKRDAGDIEWICENRPCDIWAK